MRNTRFGIGLVAACLAVGGASSLLSAGGGIEPPFCTGLLKGIAVDSNGETGPVKVIVFELMGGEVGGIRTESDGAFAFDVRPGFYEVVAYNDCEGMSSTIVWVGDCDATTEVGIVYDACR